MLGAQPGPAGTPGGEPSGRISCLGGVGLAPRGGPNGSGPTCRAWRGTGMDACSSRQRPSPCPLPDDPSAQLLTDPPIQKSPSSTRFRSRCLFAFAASRDSALGGRPGQPPGRDTGRACPREQPQRTGGGRPLLKSSLTCRTAPPPPCMDVAIASSKRTFSKPALENPWPPVLPTRVLTRATVGPCSVPPPGAPRPSGASVPVVPCLRCRWRLFRKGPRKGRHRIKQAWRAGRAGVLSKRCPNSRAGWPSRVSGRSWEAGLVGWAWSCFARGPSP